MNGKIWLIVGAILAGLAVGSGAFGAHALKEKVKVWYPDESEQTKRLGDWETAARYQMYHALGLLAIGLAMQLPSKSTGGLYNAAAICLVVGTVLFSGSLYLLVVTGETKLGMVTPVGGLLYLIGWGLFAGAIAQR